MSELEFQKNMEEIKILPKKISWLKKLIELAIKRLGSHQLCDLVMFYLTELLKTPRSSCIISSHLNQLIFKHYPITGFYELMSLPQVILYLDEENIQTQFYLDQVRFLLYNFDYWTKYSLLYMMVANKENIEHLMEKISIHDGYVILSHKGILLNYGEEIIHVYYDKFTKIYLWITTFENQIIG